MKPAAFDYTRAGSAAEAVRLFSQSGGSARFLAGGQSLLPALAFRLDAPELLIDIGRAADLRGIRVAGDRLVIGAMTRHAEVETDVSVARHAPLLARAVREVAHPAIRNRGTLGGSLALADPAAEMPACVLALGADVVVMGPGGERRMAADDFFLGLYTTALEEGELIVAVEVPLAAGARPFAFGEIARRRGDYALAGVAAVGGPEPRIAWFGVADRAVRDPGAEGALSGGAGAAEVARAALDGIEVADDPVTPADARAQLARVVLRRALVEGGLAP